MNRDDIIRLAHEAGFGSLMDAWPLPLERFAALVAAAEREAFAKFLILTIGQAVIAEREECADICDQHSTCEGIAQKCAAAIRARGESK